MTSNLDQISDDLDTALKTILSAYDVSEGSIPEADELPISVNNWFAPYVVYQVGDTRQQGSTSFIGPIGDSYTIPVYVQIVAPNETVGKKIRNMLITGFLGYSFDWSSNVRKSSSGAIFPMRRADGATKASIVPCSFTIPGVQIV